MERRAFMQSARGPARTVWSSIYTSIRHKLHLQLHARPARRAGRQILILIIFLVHSTLSLRQKVTKLSVVLLFMFIVFKLQF